jgi:uncharacterized repeat protein (TIGR01451 family)
LSDAFGYSIFNVDICATMNKNFLTNQLLALAFCFYSFSVAAQLSIPQEAVTVPISQNEIFPLDMDGDNDIDILTTNGDGIVPLYFQDGLYYSNGHTADVFTICVNDGSGNFTESPLLNLPNRSLWHFGDLDSDMLPEFLYVENNAVYLQHNDGNLNFASAQLLYQNEIIDCSNSLNDLSHFPDQIKRIGVGDVNNDDVNDVLFAATTIVCVDGVSYPDSYSLSIYVMHGSGDSLDPAVLLFTTNPGSNSFEDVNDLSVVDTDGDGLNEIVLTAGFSGQFWETHVIDNPLGYYESSYNSAIDEIILGNMDEGPGVDGVGFNNFGGGLSEINVQFVDGTFVSQWVATSVVTENVSTARFDVIDLYQDGFGDFVVSGANGQLEIFEHDLNNQGQGYTSIGIIETGINQLLNMRSADVNLDGAEDLLLMNEGHVYVLFGVAEVTPAANITLQAFYDENSNGAFDGIDVGWSHLPFELNDILSFTSSVGDYTFSAHSGNFNFAPVLNTNLFGFSTSSVLTLNLIEGMPDTTLLLGIIPANAPISRIEIYGNPSSRPCLLETETQNITIVNTGNTLISGEIIYPLNPYYNYISSDLLPNYISADTIIWSYTMLAPGQSFSVNVVVDPPGFEAMNQNLLLTFIAKIFDESGNQIWMDTDRHDFVLLCSYDPNDITEKNGYTDLGYVLANDTLDYTIRFQNTGNAPALNIRIENQLSELLQHNSILPVASSHDFTLTVDSDGLAVFRFDNIMLADSVSDEPNSHGFVRYQILPIVGLTPGTIIENTADIIFDLNPPVVTNTEITTIYDCADLQQPSISATSVCTDDEITCNNNATWIENLTWNFNGNDVGTGNYTHTVNESGTLTMHASNALCEYTQDFELTANTANASFTSNGNTLTANDAVSYQWYLNGNEITGATQQTYEITETGNYSVMVVDQNGCDGVSEIASVTHIGIMENAKYSFELFPNPADRLFTLKLPFYNCRIHVTDCAGKVIVDLGICTANVLRLDASNFRNGVYFVNVDSAKGKETLQLFVSH